VLQFARRFDAETEGKENVTGGMVFAGDGINEKLAYHPIDFDSLQLKKISGASETGAGGLKYHIIL